MSAARLCVPGLLMSALLVAARPAAADEPPKKADPAAGHEHGAKGEAGHMMMCPMMAGLAAVRLHADSPAALLGRADDLGLTTDQQKKLKEIEEAARRQARQVLTDKQREQVGKPTDAPLSVMELARMGMKGKAMDGCCPMCMKMMQTAEPKDGKGKEKDAEGKTKPPKT
jgi:hypothetical protein